MKNFSQNSVKTALCGVVGSERVFKRVWASSQQAKSVRQVIARTGRFTEKGTLFLVKVAQIDDSHCMYLHIVFVVGFPGNDMEGGGERHPGEPPRTLELFVPKWSRQETTTPAQRCAVRAHEMTRFFMYLQISRCWPE